ncbi:MAG: thioesterase family protein [Pseudomonadota bacterium]
MTDTANVEGIEVYRGKVLPEWIDVNGHMNVAYYVLAFDLGIDTLWAMFGITEEHIRKQLSSTFAVEAHVMYRQELRLDDPFFVTSQVLAYSDKGIHQFQHLVHATEGFIAATCEWINLHVNLAERRVAPWPAPMLEKIENIAAGQRELAYPTDAGRKMSLRNPLYDSRERAS